MVRSGANSCFTCGTPENAATRYGPWSSRGSQLYGRAGLNVNAGSLAGSLATHRSRRIKIRRRLKPALQTHLYNESNAGGVSVEFHVFDADYVMLLAEGDPATETHFGAYFEKFIFLKLRSRRVTPEMIEDVRQETMLRVLKALRQGAGVTYPERFGSFVNSVSNNVLLELNLKNSKHSSMDDDTPDPPDNRVNLDASLITEERKRMVAAVLDDLSAKDREILRLVFFEDIDRTAISSRLQVDPDYLRVLLHRAKAKFQTAYLKRHPAARHAADLIILVIFSNAGLLGITTLVRWN